MKKSVISIVVIFALIALFLTTALCGLNLGVFSVESAADGIPLGLDLVGGSEITYEAQIPDGTASDAVTTGMNSAIAMLRQRLDALGYTEASVYQSGEKQIVVEIPNVDDPEEAVQQLGTTAVVEFRDADSTVWLSGSDIASANYQYSAVDDTGIAKHHVVLSFTSEGRQKFTEATKAVANRSGNDNYLEIVMDDEIISMPYVSKIEYSATGIDSDSAIITLGNNATADGASYLANIISAGQLPFTLNCVKLQAVGASLGERSLDTSLMAGLIGLLLIMLFMIFTYRVMGAISCVSLAMYASLFVVVLSIGKVNLSLPGIAGIILTMGMAVDANVIIYERIQEELRAGKTLRSSIDTGYHHAVTAIVDANITTMIAAAVLWWKGTGTIISFAKALMIGTILSMIIMLIVTKILLKAAVGLNIKNPKAYRV
ncbi:MAG: protein translocase subunit SecD [Oscillospiraceae bacterium]|nr:protein translocase subunit SecD [Oscillospiraceae bacterium]